MRLPSARSVLVQYGRAVKASFVHDSHPRLGMVWSNSVASIVFVVCVVLGLVDGLSSGGLGRATLLAVLASLALAIAHGVYVVIVVRRAGLLPSDAPPPPPPD